MEKLIKYLWGIFLFTFPLSIRFIVYDTASYRFGNFNPWATGFIYLPEILLMVIFVMWFINKLKVKDHRLEFRSKWLWGFFFLFAINAFVVTLLNGNSLLGALFILRIFEGLAIFWFITDKILEPRKAITILLFGALFQILWGYVQHATNHSLGLTFFGESVLGPDILGVAKIDLADGAKQIRAYGSFLHPNIFAAYLLIIFTLSLRYLKYGSKLFWCAIFIWGVYLTHSRAAMIVGGAALLFYFIFTVFKSAPFRRSIGLTVILILTIGNFWLFQKSHAINAADVSLKERLSQNVISKNMWKANPWGVGVSNFTLKMEHYSDCGPNDGDCEPRKYLPWEFQPAHNTYFLLLNETGIQGLLILLMFFLALFDLYWREGKAAPIFALLMLAPFDHFLWDSWVGIVLIGLVAGFFVMENHRESLAEKVEHVLRHENI